MTKFLSFLLILGFASRGLADGSELPLPGPGVPTQPSEPQPAPSPVHPAPAPEPIPEPTPRYTPHPHPHPKPKPPSQSRNTYTLGTGRLGRFRERSFTFSVPAARNNIRVLRIVGTNEKMEIKSASALMLTGERTDLSFLTGPLSLGYSRITTMSGDPVIEITIVADPVELRKNGSFRLDATTMIFRPKEELGEELEGGSESNN
ncbi:MAG: hypothetical protein ACXVB4_16380 [Pseudobdellovibrionaceae bacterium]